MNVISKKALLALVIGSVISTPAISARISATASASVAEALRISSDQSLSFGGVANLNVQEVVTVDPTSCTVTTNLTHFGNHQCGQFTVSGYGNTAYIVTWSEATSLRHTVHSSIVMPFELNLAGGTSRNLASGRDELQFGGVLTVAANQASGNYTGTYSVTVNHQ